MTDNTTTRQTIVSGFRPTGKLHLGHLHGTLTNWVRLQSEYRCFFFVADWHALTTGKTDAESIRSNTEEMVIDWLSVGLDPNRSVIFPAVRCERARRTPPLVFDDYANAVADSEPHRQGAGA